jgi:hypothetical protein
MGTAVRFDNQPVTKQGSMSATNLTRSARVEATRPNILLVPRSYLIEETGMLEAAPVADLIPAWNPLWLRTAERQINPPIDGYQDEIALLCTA